MEKQRLQVYLHLIEKLLSYPSEQELIIQQNSELLDEEFLQVAKDHAQRLKQEGKELRAAFLYNLIRQITEAIYSSVSSELNFLSEVLSIVENKRGHQNYWNEFYQLISQNLDKINQNLVNAVQIWIEKNVRNLEIGDPNLSKLEANLNLSYIVIFCLSIGEFSFGNKNYNFEVAIKGLEIVLEIYSETNSYKEWANIKTSLGLLYTKRVHGNPRSNFESAIAAHKSALTVFTQTSFPKEWADVQINLGDTYQKYLAADHKNNLELAIDAYKNALKVYKKAKFPEEWANAINSLGAAYISRIAGNRSENIEQAIHFLI